MADWSYADDDDSDDYYGFDNYVKTTIEPGPWLFYGTVIAMASMVLSILPLGTFHASIPC